MDLPTLARTVVLLARTVTRNNYYQSAPANYYAAFWHAHSIAGLSYGFAHDDVNNQSSSIVCAHPEHMAFGISY